MKGLLVLALAVLAVNAIPQSKCVAQDPQKVLTDLSLRVFR